MMKSSFIGVVAVSMIMASPLSMANNKEISEANKRVIETTILCQNMPVVPEKTPKIQVYTSYIASVQQLFGDNAKDIKSQTIGMNQDHQMTYRLKSPISIVGMTFDTVYITNLKDDLYEYYQLSAVKPFTKADESIIKNIPQDDNLTVSTRDNELKISCNIKAEKTPK